MKRSKLYSLLSVILTLTMTACYNRDDMNQSSLYLTVSGSPGQINLSWNSVKCDRYQVFRSKTSPSSLSYVKDIYNITTYTDQAFNNDQPIYYQVTAVSKNGSTVAKSSVETFDSSSSSSSSSSSVSAPKSVSAEKRSGYIRVSWSSVYGASKYQVFRSSSAYGTYSCVTTTSDYSFYDYSPLDGTNYYKVLSVDSKGNTSSYSNYCYCDYSSSSSSSSSSSTTLSAPTNVSVSNTGTTLLPCMTVTWNSVSGADKYYVYRASSAYGSYTKIGTAYYATYGDSNPLSGTNYYKVTAVNSSGKESEKSSYTSIKYDQSAVSPCAPSVTASLYNNTITLTWSYSTGFSCGTPTKVTVKIFDPYYDEWVVFKTYSASTKTCNIGMASTYKTSYDVIKIAVSAENEYGSSNYTQKWYAYNSGTWY